MEKIYYKYRILINGLSLENNYEIDNFVLKTGIINLEVFNKNINFSKIGMNISFNNIIFNFLDNYKKMTYRYFESKELIEKKLY